MNDEITRSNVVVPLVNKFKCVHMIGWAKMNETLHDITPNKMYVRCYYIAKESKIK